MPSLRSSILPFLGDRQASRATRLSRPCSVAGYGRTVSSAVIAASTTLLVAGVVVSGSSARAQIITGFEGLSLGQNGNVMFRSPNFSGSTSAFLAPSPNQSVVSNERANTGTQSLRVSFQFLANQTNPFLRLSTSNPATLPNPAIDLTQALQFALFVPTGTPDFYLTLGVRETGTLAAVGQNGGTSGPIELLGATASQGGAPLGKLITTKDAWVTVAFNLPSEPVRGFTGNGVLDVSRGALESLFITPTSNANTGPYTFYLDDFRQTAIVTAAPEPSSLALLAAAVLPAATRMRKRRRSQRA